MLLEVKVPEIIDKPGIIRLVNWYVEDQAVIDSQSALCILETSKASFEIPAEKQGFVKKIKKEGDTVGVGDIICLIADSLKELSLDQ